MAKIKRNVLFQGISGTIDKNLVFRQMKDGTTILSAKPDFSKRKFSKGQLTQQSRLKEAAAYARPAAKTNPIYAKLAEGTTKNAYNIAISDWFNPPVIHSIQQQNGRILIEASDNVCVVKVNVTLLDTEEKVLEQGQAVMVNDPFWEYLTAKTGKVIVDVFDLAGNRTTQELSIS